ncbi:MAG: hypothetical protein GC154_16010 [bacterium]|nr:hypothetical protein [bacterium]
MNPLSPDWLEGFQRRSSQRREWNDQTRAALESSISNIKTQSALLDKPDEVIAFINQFIEYMNMYNSILDKIQENASGELHEETGLRLKKLHDRNAAERQRCFQFQRLYIARGLNDAKAIPLLEEVYHRILERIEKDESLSEDVKAILSHFRSKKGGQASSYHPSGEGVGHITNHPPSAAKLDTSSSAHRPDWIFIRTYRMLLTFFLKTNLGRLVIFLIFILIGVSFAQLQSQNGAGFVDSIFSPDFEKESAFPDDQRTPSASTQSPSTHIPDLEDPETAAAVESASAEPGATVEIPQN